MISAFTLWTVYKHPRDYPDKFVAREWVLDEPTSQVIVSETLEGLLMVMPRGLQRVMRHPKDDPCILETWI